MQMAEAILKQIPAVESIRTEILSQKEPFMALAARFAHLTGTVILMSGGELDCARHHILALRPWLSLRGKKHKMSLKIGQRDVSFQGHPLNTLKTVLAKAKGPLTFEPGPLQAGLFGYLTYDVKNHLENLPRTAIDDLHLPEICFYAPSLIVVQDRVAKRRLLFQVLLTDQDPNGMTENYQWFRQMESASAAVPEPFKGRPGTLRSNFSKAEYLSVLDKIHEYIAAGHIYQVNMSQRFSMAYQGSGFDLFRQLFALNPAPFFAYINAGEHEIVSTSPERFLFRNGSLLETRPIKGTRKRGAGREEDDALRRELLESPKEDAELSMIVDLLRNDLGRVCRKGSVQVTEHKRVEAYANVFHLISIVTGELTHGCDSVDVIAATFPGGSITGCPKVRAMEIIDELEPNCRHLYTGSIGYIGFNDTMDLSIAIRTALLTRGRIHFGVGGGIVFDSTAEDEFEETLHKGRTLMTACLGESRKNVRSLQKNGEEPWAWFNGSLIEAEQAAIPAMDPGFQYGHGFFETLRAEKGRVLRLAAHLERFEKSWNIFYDIPFPDLSWQEIIAQVLGRNGLTTQTAAVKLVTAASDCHRPPYHPHLLVTARPYTHRLTVLARAGLKLGVYPHPRQSPLADHKTLNYLFYFQAGRWARANGFDEALILNPDGTISETNTGNIAAVYGKTVLEPLSPHVLPGVMAAALRQAVGKQGYDVRRKPLSAKELLSADQVWVTNSLMGVVPALGLDGSNLKHCEALCLSVKQWLQA